MTWRKTSERRVGNYVWWDSATESKDLLPLLECLSNVIAVNYPLDYFLRGILTGDDSSPSGGDPGWALYQDRVEGGQIIYHAWTNVDISELDPCEGDYDEDTVKRHVRRTLDNFAEAHPERQPEVDKVVARYALAAPPD